MLKISYRNQFKKELKHQEKRGRDLKKFLEVAKNLLTKNLLILNKKIIDLLETSRVDGSVILSLIGFLSILKLMKKLFLREPELIRICLNKYQLLKKLDLNPLKYTLEGQKRSHY